MSQKATVYILHGWSVSDQNDHKWQPLMSELEKHGVSSRFLGLPGLSTPLNEVWNLQNYVEWVMEQLPSNKKVILLGHSFGGQIAIRLSALRPERVAKLVLIDSSGVRDHSLKAVLKRKLFWVLAKVGSVFFKFSWARTLLYKLARERDYNNAPPLLKRTMSMILEDEVLEDLPKIQAPTQIVWGQGDQVTPIWMGQKMHKLIPDSSLEIVSGARHSPQYTHIEQVASTVAAFVLEN